MIDGLRHTFLSIGNKKNPSHLFFILHGYGASADGISELARVFMSDYPEALFLIPQAPHPFPWDPQGAMWFEIGDLNPTLLMQGLKECVPDFLSDVSLWSEFYGVSKQDRIVMGFSQGAMMALSLNYLSSTPCMQTVVSFSGGIPFKIESCDQEDRYLIVHGKEDDVVVPERGLEAADILKSAGASVEVAMLEGLGHSINYEAIERTKKFFKKVLREK